MKTEIAAPEFPPQWSSAGSRAWVIGQLLNVTVIGPADQKSTLLKVGAETVVATGPAPVSPGARFIARVVSLHPLPLLEPIKDERDSLASREEAIALRTLLPRQVEFAPGLRVIDERTRSLERAAHGRDLPALIHTTKALLAEIPTLTELSAPPELERAVARSGAGLEAALVRCLSDPKTPLPTLDRKWQLLSLVRQVELFFQASSAIAAPPEKSHLPDGADLPRDRIPRATPAAIAAWDSVLSAFSTELKETLEGMVARITTRQLQMTEAASLGQVFGLFELPVRIGANPEVLQLQYSRKDEDGDPGDAKRHSLLIVVPLAGPSQLRVRLTLRADQLSIVAWADDEALRDQMVHRRDELQTRLTAVGLGVEEIIVAPVDGPDDAAHLPERLISMAI